MLDIAKLVKWDDVKRSIKYYYPTDKNNYEELFIKLGTLRKRKHKDEEEELEIACASYQHPFFKNHTLQELYEETYYSIATNKYGLSFRKYQELVNIPISIDALNHYKLEEIMAHFIWEITFYGNEEQAKERADYLKKAVKEIKKDAKKCTIPVKIKNVKVPKKINKKL